MKVLAMLTSIPQSSGRRVRLAAAFHPGGRNGAGRNEVTPRAEGSGGR